MKSSGATRVYFYYALKSGYPFFVWCPLFLHPLFSLSTCTDYPEMGAEYESCQCRDEIWHRYSLKCY